MSTKPLRIGVVAGEASGDVLAAGLISEIKRRHPDAIIEGIGGEHMIAAGCHSLFDIETLSVMGLVEVLSSIRRILAVKKALISHFKANPPDVYIGVDAPDFNLRVEKELKDSGIKTIHYVSPTVWAWREKRIHKIAKATNRVFGIFPFEEEVYKRYQVPYTFVGHTMADNIALEPDQIKARHALALPTDGAYLAVLPGSRKGEVNSLLGIFIETVEEVWAAKPLCRILIPAANERRYEQIKHWLEEHKPQLLDDNRVYLIKGHSREAMIASDVILLASGTATLEAMLCKRPMVAAYIMNWLTHQMMKKLYKAPYFTLPNVLANQPLIPELLQDEVNPTNLSQRLLDYFERDNTGLINAFTHQHKRLKMNADVRAADAVFEVINGA
jgi:lipid-A-disaccharide synthase